MPKLNIDYNAGALLSAEWRQRIWCGAIALAISALCGLAVAIYIVSNVQDTVTHNANISASHNCQALARGVRAGDRFRFAVREELSVIPAAAQASAGGRERAAQQSRAFFAHQLVLLNVALAKERRTVPGLPRHLDSYDDLFPFLADQPLITCVNGGARR